MLCGIDEAGRGCIIGPLVICGVKISPENEIKLKELGVKDSKLLTPEKRESMYDEIRRIVTDYCIIQIPAHEVDEAVLSSGMNLNWLEAHKTAEILKKLKPLKAFVDCPSTNTKAYKSYLTELMGPGGPSLVAEHKADVKYPVVSAASILAKVDRDRAIDAIKKSIGVDFGSGYCSDPVTAKFLEEHWATYPEVFRHSWAPYQKKRSEKSQKSLMTY